MLIFFLTNFFVVYTFYSFRLIYMLLRIGNKPPIKL